MGDYMTLWKVNAYFYNNSNTPIYKIAPYDLLGHLKCCLQWYGLKGLKWCYLFKKQAENKANKLNNKIKERF